jgi:leucyl/phenylalanyl-tRNA--protein transferase
MFFLKTDASKVALAALVEQLKRWGFQMFDAQVTSRHLLSLGAKEVPRSVFLRRLKKALDFPTIKGKWEIDR